MLNKVFRRWSTTKSKQEKKSKHQKTERKNTKMPWILSPLHTWLRAWLACRLLIISLTDQPLWQCSSLFCVFIPFLFPEPLGFTHFDFVDNFFCLRPSLWECLCPPPGFTLHKHLYFLLLPSSPSRYLSWALPCKAMAEFCFLFFSCDTSWVARERK